MAGFQHFLDVATQWIAVVGMCVLVGVSTGWGLYTLVMLAREAGSAAYYEPRPGRRARRRAARGDR